MKSYQRSSSRRHPRRLSVETLERRALMDADASFPPLAPIGPTETAFISLSEGAQTSLIDGASMMVHEPVEATGTHYDPFFPNFAALAPLAGGELRQSYGDGNWSDLFSNAGPNDIVEIRHRVILNVSANVHTIVISDGGHLEFATNQDLTLQVVTLQELAGGELIIGTEQAPVQGDVEIIIKDVAIDPNRDPGQYGNGLVAAGLVRMHGRTLESTFVRLATEATAGSSSLAVDGDLAGWESGDSLLFPDSRQIFYTDHVSSKLDHYETESLAGVANGAISLNQALNYSHLGARDADGTLRFTPHIANLTRNITIRSENPEGARGHTMFMGRADVDIRYVSFQDLGRTSNAPLDNTIFDALGNATHIGTNQQARYALHTHHLIGLEAGQANGYQFTLIGNAVANESNAGQQRWGLVIHASHFGLIDSNIVYNVSGAGIVTENGSESYNMISNNFVSRIDGTRDRGKFTDGREGSGFWMSSPNNFYVGNVVSGAEKSGFAIYGSESGGRASIALPAFRGANPHGVDRVMVAPESMHVLQFDDNEAYASYMGVEIWYLGYENYFEPTTMTVHETEFNDLRLWHIDHTAIFGEQANTLTIRNLVVIGDQSLMTFYNKPTGIYIRRVNSFTSSNAIIENMRVGVSVPERTGPLDPGLSLYEISPFLIEGGLLRNSVNIDVKTPTEAASSQRPTRYTSIRNVHFDTNSGSAVPVNNIVMSYDAGRVAWVVQPDVVEVENYDGDESVNFRLYYNEQRPSFIVPQTGSVYSSPVSPVGSPVAGLTNAETWQMYGIAVGGEVAPGDATSADRMMVPGIVGLAFPLFQHIAPPAITGIDPDPGTIGDFVTSDGNLILSGVARQAMPVVLYRDGENIGSTVANSQGEWQFDYSNVQLAGGSYDFAVSSPIPGSSYNISDPVVVSVFTQAPSISGADFTTNEGVEVDSLVGTIATSDPDIGDAVSLQIESGNEGRLFKLEAASGRLLIAKDLGNVTNRGVHEMTILATDRAGLISRSTVSITIAPRTAGVWVTELTYPNFNSLSPQEIGFLTPEQLSTIPSRDWFMQIPEQSRLALTGDQVRGLKIQINGMITGLSNQQILQLSDSQVRTLGGGQFGYLDFAALPPTKITLLTAQQISQMPSQSSFLRIPAESRAALTLDQVQAVNIAPPGMISGLTSSQILQLSAEQVRSLGSGNYGYLDFAYLPAMQVVHLTSNQIALIPSSSGFQLISAPARAALTELQVRAINVSSSGMISGLTGAQVAMLTVSQVQSLRLVDFMYLPPSQIINLTHEQLRLISSLWQWERISLLSRSRLAQEGIFWANGELVIP